MTIKKTHKINEIKLFFYSIKKDNLLLFNNLIKNNDKLLSLENNKRENILFYAFKYNSQKVIKKIIDIQPNFIKEKNILNLYIIHELLLNHKNIDLFIHYFKNLSKDDKEKLFATLDLNGNNIFLLAAKHSNINNLIKLIKLYENFSTNQFVSNHNNQNLFHLLANQNKEDLKPIFDYLDPKLLQIKDNINGYYPVQIAAFNQDIQNFKLFFNFDKDNSFTKEKITHFAAYNNDINVMKYIIDNDLFDNKKDILGQTPLSIAISKSKIDMVNLILNEINKKDNQIIYQEDLINAIKFSSKEQLLFDNIFYNNKKEKLDFFNSSKFIEQLFFYAQFSKLKNIIEKEELEVFDNNFSFKNILIKTMAGKKDMLDKINYILSNKENLNTEEVIDFAESIKILPKNQLHWLIKNSIFLSKVNKEDFPVLTMLYIKKGLDRNFFPPIETNNFKHQKFFKNFIKENTQTLNESMQHFSDLLTIIYDKKIVFKYYGNLISKEIEPFEYIKSIENLSKENKKDLLYFTVVSLFKYNKELSENIINQLNNFPNLVTTIIKDIINSKKIPKTQKMLSLVKNKNFLSQNSLINLIERNSENEDIVFFINNYIDFFNIENIKDINLTKAIFNSSYSNELFEKFINYFPDNKLDLINNYLSLVYENKLNNIDTNIVKNHILNNEYLKPKLNNMFINFFENNNNDIKTLENLWFMSDIKKEDINFYAQNLINSQRFQDFTRLQKVIKNNLMFNYINFNFIDWNELNITYILNYKNKNSLFSLLKNNEKNLTIKQTEILLNKFNEFIINNSISFEVVNNLINSIDIKISSIDKEKINNLTINLIDNFYRKENIFKNSEKDFFNETLITLFTYLNIEQLKSIQKNVNFNSFDIKIQSSLYLNLLNKDLTVNNEVVNKKSYKI